MLSCLVPPQPDAQDLVDWTNWHLAIEIPQGVPSEFAVGVAHGIAVSNPGLNVLVQYGDHADVQLWMTRKPGPRATSEERRRNNALMFNVMGLFTVFAGDLSQAMEKLKGFLHDRDQEVFPGGTKPTLM